VVGPERAHGDADREKHPGKERPRPHPPRPGRVDAAFDQRRNGEGKGDREADVAEVEQRRMDGEAGILENRVEVAPLERRVGDARGWVGGNEDEKKKPRGGPPPHGNKGRLESRGEGWAQRGQKTGEDSGEKGTK